MNNDFDAIAPVYDGLSYLVFGRKIIDSQMAFLTELPAHGRVLLIGGGTGKVLNHLLSGRPHLTVDYVETSAQMIAQAKRNLSPQLTDRVNWIHGTERSIRPERCYTVVFTAYFLDVFSAERLPMVFDVIGRYLLADGLWFYTDFSLLPQSALWKKALVKLMYCFFRFTTRLEGSRLIDVHPLFAERGYTCQKEKRFFSGLMVSRVYRKG